MSIVGSSARFVKLHLTSSKLKIKLQKEFDTFNYYALRYEKILALRKVLRKVLRKDIAVCKEVY